MDKQTLLAGQVAVVTGAGRGIGRAAALALSRAGAAVILAARSADEIISVADAIKHEGGKALAIPTDVSDLAQVDHLLVLTMRAYGRVDILVNNAAVVRPIGKVWETGPMAWGKTLAINVLGPYLCSRAVLPHMIERNSGRIINVSSGAADHDIEGASAYCASKAALERFGSTLALELKETNIRVTTFRPGIVDTHMQTELRETSAHQFPRVGDWQAWHNKGLLRSIDEPGQAILWLASQFVEKTEQQLFSMDDAAFQQQIIADLGEISFTNR